MSVIWVVTLYVLLDRFRRFGETYCFRPPPTCIHTHRASYSGRHHRNLHRSENLTLLSLHEFRPLKFSPFSRILVSGSFNKKLNKVSEQACITPYTTPTCVPSQELLSRQTLRPTCITSCSFLKHEIILISSDYWRLPVTQF